MVFKQYALRKPIPDYAQKSLAKYPELIQQLLFHRGIITKKAAHAFLNPDYDKHTYDPFLMLNMNRAVDRILKAIKKKEHIAIYSDYDCDGIPGGVLLHDFFKKIGYKNFQNYIPHRHHEGYGLNVGAIEKLAEEGVTLIITVDCGITDVEPVQRANELGVDVVVTDHHLPNGVLPDAYAIVNSKQDNDTYPDPMLCGAGVAFKLVQALIQKGNFDIKEGWEKWLLDLAGLSTIADMVPLQNENRVLAYYGLQVLRKSRRPGLQQLLQKAKLDQRELTEDDIGFTIGPRINAASRMGIPMDAFSMLATDDVIEGAMLADHLHKINDERKGHVAAMSKEIKRRLNGLAELRDVIVMGNPTWKPALLGLAANSVAEAYNRPVFLWGFDGNGTIKGSCRSDGVVNLVDLMQGLGDVFHESGGHAFSGGFWVKKEQIHTLENALNENYKRLAYTMKQEEPIFIDKALKLSDVTWDTHNLLEALAPFGTGNEKPRFLFANVAPSKVRPFGKRREHLELVFVREGKSNISAIGFFTGLDSFQTPLEEKQPIDLIGTIEKSVYGGRRSLRLRIEDIQPPNSIKT